jgi:hypothetical protein
MIGISDRLRRCHARDAVSCGPVQIFVYLLDHDCLCGGRHLGSRRNLRCAQYHVYRRQRPRDGNCHAARDRLQRRRSSRVWLAESLVLAISGAAIGAIAAWIAFNGNLHAVGGLVFRLAVTPSLVGLGIIFAFGLGFIGGILPAIRAARLPVADALRAT